MDYRDHRCGRGYIGAGQKLGWRSFVLSFAGMRLHLVLIMSFVSPCVPSLLSF